MGKSSTTGSGSCPLPKPMRPSPLPPPPQPAASTVQVTATRAAVAGALRVTVCIVLFMGNPLSCSRHATHSCDHCGNAAGALHRRSSDTRPDDLPPAVTHGGEGPHCILLTRSQIHGDHHLRACPDLALVDNERRSIGRARGRPYCGISATAR